MPYVRLSKSFAVHQVHQGQKKKRLYMHTQTLKHMCPLGRKKISVLILYICPHTAIYVSAYCHVCPIYNVLILLYAWSSLQSSVLILLYMWSSLQSSVLILLYMWSSLQSSVLILLHMWSSLQPPLSSGAPTPPRRLSQEA
jgi:hypothetical protein